MPGIFSARLFGRRVLSLAVPLSLGLSGCESESRPKSESGVESEAGGGSEPGGESEARGGSEPKGGGEPGFEGRRISEVVIRYVGPTTVEEARLRNLMNCKAGDPYVPDRFDADIRALYESGLVEDVRFLVEQDGKGMRLIAEISTRPGTGPVRFVGNTVFPDKTLGERLGLAAQPAASKEFLAAACRDLERFYREHGYGNAKVSTRAFRGGEARGDDYVFVIVEGARTAR